MRALYIIKSREKWTTGNIGWYSHYRRYDGIINPKQWIADQKLDSSLQAKNGQKSTPQITMSMDASGLKIKSFS